MDGNLSMIMLLQALTEAHAGSGTELSYVDLPIQREIHTGFPNIEASTLKGCIRSSIREGIREKEQEKALDRILGSFENGDQASAVSVTDARLLFFPVKSVAGIFAWVTCPFALRRFRQDYEIAFGVTSSLEIPEFSEKEGGMTAYYPGGGSSDLLIQVAEKNAVGKTVKKIDRIMLEDFTFTAESSKEFGAVLAELVPHLPYHNTKTEGEEAGRTAERSKADGRFCSHTILISDNMFEHFVKYATEVTTRIKISPETGTVDGTALFTEEYLPPESILYSLLFFSASHRAQKEEKGEKRLEAREVKQKFEELFRNPVFQVGADGTLGKGLFRKTFWEVGENG